MEAKTKLQKRITILANTLRPITEAQKRYAEAHCFEAKIYRQKNECWCGTCGHSWHTDEGELIGEVVGMDCPFCGAKAERVERTRRVKEDTAQYLTVIGLVGGIQVLRHFFITKWIRKGEKPQYEYREAIQEWITDSGKYEVRSLNRRGGIYYDCWINSSRLTFKTDKNHDRYKPYGWTYPRMRIMPILLRNGYKGEDIRLSPSEVMRTVMKSSQAETLIKAGQKEMLAHVVAHGDMGDNMWRSVTICIRHGYMIQDCTMWSDMYNYLRRLGMDTRNPRYVCPIDLNAWHGELQRRWGKVSAKRKEEGIVKEMESNNEAYIRDKAPYLGIMMSDGNINLHVLQSVGEFYEEGNKMHHCVYDMKYFAKPESLILSARNKEGQRLETVEVNLKHMNVVQSRAVCNAVTPFHGEIIDVVNRNINMIERAAKTALNQAI